MREGTSKFLFIVVICTTSLARQITRGRVSLHMPDMGKKKKKITMFPLFLATGYGLRTILCQKDKNTVK